MPRYDTLDSHANASELDPCLAAKVRLKENSVFNWKILCAGIASLLLLLVVGGALLYTFVFKETESQNVLTAESSSNQLNVQVSPALPTTQVPISTTALPTVIQHRPHTVKLPLIQPTVVQTSAPTTPVILPTTTLAPVTLSTTTLAPKTQTVPETTKAPVIQPVVLQAPASVTFNVQISKPSVSGRHLSSDKLGTINTVGNVFATCEEYLRNGFTQTGVYRLYRPNAYDFSAQCVMNESKAWMVMQKRTSGEIVFWNRSSDEYVQGFGAPTGDHWLGLKQVRDLIDAGYKLQLKVEIEGERCKKELSDLYYVGIWNFQIDSSANSYQLRVSEIVSGNFTDPLYNMANGNSLSFSPTGQGTGNPANCLEKLHLGGWWSVNNGCTFISLNGEYTCAKDGTLYGLAVYSRATKNAAGTFKPTYIRPQSTRMMVHVCNGEENCL